MRIPVKPLFRARFASALALVFAALLSLPGAGGAAGPAGSWLGWGNGQQRWDSASTSPASVGRRFVLPLQGRITNQVLAANGSFCVATSSGAVAAFDGNGFERWQTEVGQFAQPCKQLNGYGVTGTGVIDPSSATSTWPTRSAGSTPCRSRRGRSAPAGPCRSTTTQTSSSTGVA